MNSAPDTVDEGWGEHVTAYFTFGPGSSTGTYVLTFLGIALFLAALVAWVVTENRKLQDQAARLRQRGLETESMPGGDAHHVPGEA